MREEHLWKWLREAQKEEAEEAMDAEAGAGEANKTGMETEV